MSNLPFCKHALVIIYFIQVFCGFPCNIIRFACIFLWYPHFLLKCLVFYTNRLPMNHPVLIFCIFQDSLTAKNDRGITWGTLRKEGAPRLLYLKLKIVVLKRYSLSAMPFLLCCVPVLLNALGTLLPFLRDWVPLKCLHRCSKCPLAEHAFRQSISVHTR